MGLGLRSGSPVPGAAPAGKGSRIGGSAARRLSCSARLFFPLVRFSRRLSRGTMPLPERIRPISAVTTEIRRGESYYHRSGTPASALTPARRTRAGRGALPFWIRSLKMTARSPSGKKPGQKTFFFSFHYYCCASFGCSKSMLSMSAESAPRSLRAPPSAERRLGPGEKPRGRLAARARGSWVEPRP